MFKHKFILGSYYFVFLNILVYMIPFLLQKGINSSTIGFLNSSALFIVVLVFLLSGIITDLIKSNKLIIYINLIISSFALFSMIFITNLYLIGFLYLLIWGTFMSITPIIDGLILKDLGEQNYSKVRSFGSLGAAISYLFGSLFMKYMPLILPYDTNSSVYINLLLLINIILIISIIYTLRHIKEQNISDSFNYKLGFKHIFKSSNLLLIIIITAFTYGVLAADDAYSYSYNIDVVKIGLITFGIVGFLSIGFESLIVNYYNQIEKKLGFKNIMIFISCLLIIIFYTKSNFYTIPWIINLGNVSLGIFTGLFIPLSVILINQNTDPSVRNTVLAIYQMANKLGGAILGLITASYVSHGTSLPDIYTLHMSIVIFSLIFIFFLKSNRKKV